MRQIACLAAILAMTAACEPIPTASTGPVATTPFTHKANVPAATRQRDFLECENGARGVSIDATSEEIAEGTAATTAEQRRTFVQRCFSAKGYTQTEVPVCQPADARRGTLVFRPEFLPPLNSIVCLDPSVGGIRTTAPVSA